LFRILRSTSSLCSTTRSFSLRIAVQSARSSASAYCFAQAFRRKSSKLRSSRKTKIRYGNKRTRFNSKIIELTTDHGATDLRMKSNQIDRRFSFRAIWSEKLQALGPIAFFTVVVWLCSCDANLFGPESREIAGGYRLKRANNPNEFALTIPNEDGGLIIDEIGWREPLIFARASGSQYWDVINTARAQHIRVSDLQRKSDPLSQSIQIKSAEIAWKELNRHRRLW
jgi:hypothetical protein